MAQLIVDLPDALVRRIEMEAAALQLSLGVRVVQVLEGSIAPAENINRETLIEGIEALKTFLTRISAVTLLSASDASEAYWWIKLQIDIKHPLAWNVVQELGHILNYISLGERLPTAFVPVSPPPYLNSGPEEFLSWIIEAKLQFVDAGYIGEILEGHLPQPVEDLRAWANEAQEDVKNEDNNL